MTQYTTFWTINGETDRYLVDPIKRKYRKCRMPLYGLPESVRVPYRSNIGCLEWFDRWGLKHDESLELESR